MHVKQQVRDFVHDVKRKFSSKHNRDSTCSTCAIDGYDGASSYSNADTYGTTDDSSSASSLPNTPRRKRLISFMHHHAPPSPPKEHNVLHKVRRVGSKRYRLFSAPSMPSMRADPVETEPLVDDSVWEQGPTVDSSGTSEAPQEDYPDVMDISSCSVNIDSVTPEDSLFRDSASQSQLPFDTQSRSETSGTLFTAASTDFKKSVSDSDSRFDSINLNSDENPAPPVSPTPSVSPIPSITPMAQDAEVPAVPPKSDPAVTLKNTEGEEIALAQSTTVSSPVVSQAPRINEPAHPIRSTTASPAPVYIPRLTASSMFLPIPNTDPLSALLTKYVTAEQRPRRDVVGEYAGRDIHEMVMSNSWRALARMARDRIVASDPEDLGRILDLWSLRLSSLARLRLTNQASAECTNLFAVLNAVHPTSAPGSFPGSGTLAPSIPLPLSPAPGAPASLSPSGLSGLAQLPETPSQRPSALPMSATRHVHELSHPFELTVFHARVHYWSGDPLGYVDALSRILGRCKERAREEGRIVAQRRELGKSKSGSERRSEPDRSEDAKDVKENTGVQDTGDVEEAEADEDEDTVGEKEDAEGSGEGEGEDTEAVEESTVDSKARDEDGEIDEVLAAAEANFSMWLERIARVCLMLASQMVEMSDYQAAINLLTPLCTRCIAPTFLPTPSLELHSALARVYLLSGNLGKAEEHFSIATSAAANSADSSDITVTNTALLAAASGNWIHAEAAFSEIVAKQPRNFTAINNLAVIFLYQGRINEGIELLEGALDTSPSAVVVAEPFLFNLSTLYELRSAAAIDRKRELLIKVAQWSGDGMKTSCLKMPSS